jgi:hypothetical protein
MKQHSNTRSVTRMGLCIISILLTATFALGAPADKQQPVQAQAQLLDHAEFLCANCFFGASDYYYCFQAGNQILVGYEKTPVLNYQDQAKNYLTPVRPKWAPWTAPGQTVPIGYDDKYIWVTRPEVPPAKENVWAHLRGFAVWATRGNSKQVKLRRSDLRDIFLNNDLCRAKAK